MKRAQKEELVGFLSGAFKDAETIVVTHYEGLTVAQLSDLRKQMREVGASFKVTKNRLARLALDGTGKEGLAALFSGPTAIAYSKDPVAPAKVAAGFARSHEKLVLLGGIMGNTVLDVEGVSALATLPSLDEIRGKLVGLLQAPATKLAGVSQAPAGQLARVFAAYGAKGEAA